PTLLHMIGIDVTDYILFGIELFFNEHKTFVPFRIGDFITVDFRRDNGVYQDNGRKAAMEEPMAMVEDVRESRYKELDMWDDVLYGDLLRFYTANDEWEPVDPSEFNYGKKEH